MEIGSSYLPVLGELRGICPQSRLMCQCDVYAPSTACAVTRYTDHPGIRSIVTSAQMEVKEQRCSCMLLKLGVFASLAVSRENRTGCCVKELPHCKKDIGCAVCCNVP